MHGEYLNINNTIDRFWGLLPENHDMCLLKRFVGVLLTKGNEHIGCFQSTTHDIGNLLKTYSRLYLKLHSTTATQVMKCELQVHTLVERVVRCELARLGS